MRGDNVLLLLVFMSAGFLLGTIGAVLADHIPTRWVIRLLHLLRMDR